MYTQKQNTAAFTEELLQVWLQQLGPSTFELACAMGKDCLGPWWKPHLKCRLKDGGPKRVETKGCRKCGMQRCKSHCKCAGTKHAKGRSAPRPAHGTSLSAAPSASSSSSSNASASARLVQPEPELDRVVPPALGRPSPLAAEGFLDTSSLDEAKRELRTARSIIIAALALLCVSVFLCWAFLLWETSSFSSLLANQALQG